MKNQRLTIVIMLTVTAIAGMSFALKSFNKEKSELTGAWKTTFTDADGNKTTGILIFSDNSFTETYFSPDEKEFYYTLGGTWKKSGSKIKLNLEFNTKEPSTVGSVTTKSLKIGESEKTLTYDKRSWQQLDDGTPGKLAGAWLITGREQDGEMGQMTPGVRRTMKILSGTRFQWIAYNVETKEFFGTGGGTYTTDEGNYIENIDFFSRDGSRVGMSLEFEFEIENDIWHHKGFSSKGDPMYEIWTRREALKM